jgi:hypothetical protein
MLEYKNLGLNLQMLAPVNSLIDRPDDVPGAIKYYKPGPNGEKPEWAQPPSGQILNALIQIFNLIIGQMQRSPPTRTSRPTRTSPPAPSGADRERPRPVAVVPR